MSDRNGQRQPGGAGAASEDLIALAGQRETTVPAVVAQEKPRKGMVLEDTTIRKPVVEEAIEEPTNATFTEIDDAGGNWVCWQDPDELIVETQPRTCCYENTRGQIVLRQQTLDYDEEDPYLVFNKEYAPRIIHAFAKHLSPGAMMDIMRALEKNYLL